MALPAILPIMKGGAALLKFAPFLLGLGSTGKNFIKSNKNLKYVLYLVLVIVAYVSYKKYRERNMLFSEVDEIDRDSHILAETLILHLGTDKNKSFWDISTWTEDDRSAYDVLEQIIESGQFSRVERIYKNLSDDTLMEDLRTHLDSKYYERFLELLNDNEL